jgi:hypothetical protein
MADADPARRFALPQLSRGRPFAAPVLALLLSGCWLGGDLFGPADAQHLVPPGLYRGMTAVEDRAPATFRVTSLPDGMTNLQSEDGGGTGITMGIRPLPGKPGLFMTWLERPDGRDADFALLRPEADGTFTLYAPACNLTLDILQVVGVAPGMDGALPSCVFSDRAAVEAALRLFSDRMERQRPLRVMRLPSG